MNITHALRLTLALAFLAAPLSGFASEGSKNRRAVKDLIASFSTLDWDGNGSISYGEYTANLRGLPGALQKLFRSIDRNNNQSISLGEFAKYMRVKLPDGTEARADVAKQEFRQLDYNGDDLLTLEEIGIATTFTDAAAMEAYFASLDLNGNGSVTLGEFRKARKNDSIVQEFRRFDIDSNGILTLKEIGIATTFTDAAAMRAFFAGLDINGNGRVNLSEFRQSRKADPIAKEFRNLDFDSNGLLTIEEIGIVITFPDAATMEEYFTALDTDNSGGIDLREYREGQL